MRSVGLGGLLVGFIVASAALPASSATWHIYADGSGDAPTIAAAVGLAAAGDSVLVYPGTYYEHNITVTRPLFIAGAAGYGSTIIDAQSLGRCFSCNTRTPTVTIKGFTLRQGISNDYYSFGGAFYCVSRAKVDLIDCAFRNNSANYGGAAYVSDSSTVNFKRCFFFDNGAFEGKLAVLGGAIFLKGNGQPWSSTQIDSCLFLGNMADDGAAIGAVSYASAHIYHSTFYQNHAGSMGGALSFMYAVLLMDNTIVASSDGYGVMGDTEYIHFLYHCDFYGNSSGDFWNLPPNWGKYCIYADPLFCNPPGDLSISTISPCSPAFNEWEELIGWFGPSCEKGPNLVITNVEWSNTNPQPGSTIIGTMTMKNVGDLAPSDWLLWVSYYKDPQSPPHGGYFGEQYWNYHDEDFHPGDSVSWTISPVTNPYFGEWHSYFAADPPDYVLEVNESDNISGPHTIVWQVPGESGWPTVSGAAFHSSPVVAAIDDDPMNLEVAIGCDNGKLYVWRHDGTDAPGFPVTLPAAIWSSPAVGNVTGDYRNEIVVGCDDGRLYVFNSHGTKLWRYSIGGTVRATPSLADLDGDGRLEIICASATAIHVLDGRGEPFKGWPYMEEVTFASTAVGDVDEDGVPEIAAVARSGELVSKVYLFEANGELHAGAWPVQLDGIVTAGPALGSINIDQSGLEIVVGSTEGRVYVVTTAGVVWTMVPQVKGSIASSPIIEDVDRNGQLDIVVTSKIYELGGKPPAMRWDGYVTAIDRKGSIMAGWPQEVGYWASDVGPAPSAVALGNYSNAMAGSPCNHFFSWYGSWYESGSRTPSFPIYFGANVITSAAAGDVDGDGWIEIFVATSGGQVHGRELRSPDYTKDNLWWPMYGHDRARTHCYGFEMPTAATAVDDEPAEPTVTALGSICPNPFNPLTKISFDLSAKEHVELAIYDVSGRKITVLVNRELGAGKHETFWNGRTTGGGTAVSGIYFCTLRTASVSETKKLVLLR